jgi:hypothetical protein
MPRNCQATLRKSELASLVGGASARDLWLQNVKSALKPPHHPAASRGSLTVRHQTQGDSAPYRFADRFR